MHGSPCSHALMISLRRFVPRSERCYVFDIYIPSPRCAISTNVTSGVWKNIPMEHFCSQRLPNLNGLIRCKDEFSMNWRRQIQRHSSHSISLPRRSEDPSRCLASCMRECCNCAIYPYARHFLLHKARMRIITARHWIDFPMQWGISVGCMSAQYIYGIVRLIVFVPPCFFGWLRIRQNLAFGYSFMVSG